MPKRVFVVATFIDIGLCLSISPLENSASWNKEHPRLLGMIPIGVLLSIAFWRSNIFWSVINSSKRVEYRTMVVALQRVCYVGASPTDTLAPHRPSVPCRRLSCPRLQVVLRAFIRPPGYARYSCLNYRLGLLSGRTVLPLSVGI